MLIVNVTKEPILKKTAKVIILIVMAIGKVLRLLSVYCTIQKIFRVSHETSKVKKQLKINLIHLPDCLGRVFRPKIMKF